jgi:bifunctional NMN adenylyltransferase/nudix hydrolase
MDIPKEINVEKYDVGVVVARFQIDELHPKQREMLDIVTDNHKKVIIFLGITNTLPTRRNPLDFASRQSMVQSSYPSAIILPLRNMREDADWSRQLDSKIREVFPHSKPLLYGSRDSFIPHYKGNHQTVELTTTSGVSGTQVREEISRQILNTPTKRAGAIHAIHALPPKLYPTVDVCAYNGKGQVLLAKKPNEKLFRFVGGFVDASDINYEQAAYREFMEETNKCHVGNLKYILSTQVDDWRYRREVDGIMTTLFLGPFGHGNPQGSDDIEKVRWFDVSDLSNPDFIKRNIMPEHRDMIARLVQKVYEEELIPNLGEFYEKKVYPVDPDIVQPSGFKINL